MEHEDQSLDDAEIFYALVGNLILLRILPYQETEYRYLVYNDKVQRVERLDAIADACVLLPEDHGLIFSRGYYLQTGDHKIFDSNIGGLVYEKCVTSPNGEDYLYVFYHPDSGDYVLLSYNIIEQRVENPIACHGYSFFEDGQMALFRADTEPQKHHAIQLWQTPYVGQNYQTHAQVDSFLYKVGNKDIVRAMSECHELISLSQRDDSYANLYDDLFRKSTGVIDTYFWLDNAQAFNLREPLEGLRDAAQSAVDEFDKVVRVRKNTEAQFKQTSQAARQAITSAATRMFQHIDDFVKSLTELRQSRGEVIGLLELKYVDKSAVEQLESEIADNTDRISHQAVEFLLRDESLRPYQERVEQQRASIDGLEKVAAARELAEQLEQGAADLEMLIDVVSNLKIDDATQRTAIIDRISGIYSQLNQARATLRKKTKELMSVEGVAEFNSQLKLLSQAIVNYLDVSDTPERCDEYLTKMMVQVEELEGRFAEFDEFILQLAEKRDEIYAAFDARKVGLVEARNKRATSLLGAAERILKGIQTRVGNLESVNEINSYFAADLMIDKVRDIVSQLQELEDTVKVDDIQSRLKTIREDAVRQLKDRQELFVDGDNIIRLGKHKFSVNVQPLELTTVLKDDQLFLHMTGTNFMEALESPELEATRPVWEQDLPSENRDVYRAEYLAYQMFLESENPSADIDRQEMRGLDDEALQQFVQKFMAPRYRDGYVKGVHDHDGALVLRALLRLDESIGLLRYHGEARALANLFWAQLADKQLKEQWTAKLNGIGAVTRLFPAATGRQRYVKELSALLREFLSRVPVFDPAYVDQAAGFLFDDLTRTERSVSFGALELVQGFENSLRRRDAHTTFQQGLKKLKSAPLSQYQLLQDWLTAYIDDHGTPEAAEFLNEAASVMLDGSAEQRQVLTAAVRESINGLVGDHSRLEGDTYTLDYNEFRYCDWKSIRAKSCLHLSNTSPSKSPWCSSTAKICASTSSSRVC